MCCKQCIRECSVIMQCVPLCNQYFRKYATHFYLKCLLFIGILSWVSFLFVNAQITTIHVILSKMFRYIVTLNGNGEICDDIIKQKQCQILH